MGTYEFENCPVNATPTFAGTVSRLFERTLPLHRAARDRGVCAEERPTRRRQQHRRESPEATPSARPDPADLDEGDRPGRPQPVARRPSRSGTPAPGTLDYTITVDPGNGPAGWVAATPASGSSTGEHDLDRRRRSTASLLAPGAFAGIVHVDAGTQRVDVRVERADRRRPDQRHRRPFGFGERPRSPSTSGTAGVGVLSLQRHEHAGVARRRPDDRHEQRAASTDQTIQLTRRPQRPRRRPLRRHAADRSRPGPGHPLRRRRPSRWTSTCSGGVLAVTPADDFKSSGTVGGPFAPARHRLRPVEQRRRRSRLDARRRASRGCSSRRRAARSRPAATTTVTASIDQAYAATLPAGSCHDDLAFANATNGRGDTTRTADLVVNDPNLQAVIYARPQSDEDRPLHGALQRHRLDLEVERRSCAGTGTSATPATATRRPTRRCWSSTASTRPAPTR